MEQKSCTSGTNVSAKITLNVASMQFEHKINVRYKYGINFGRNVFELPFIIVENDAEIHKGEFIYSKNSGNLSCIMFNVTCLKVSYDSNSDRILNEFETRNDVTNAKHVFLNIGKDQTSLLKKLIITFEPKINQAKMLNEKIEEYLKIIEPFVQSEKAEDFLIICKNKEFLFEKSLLGKISPVFRDMFENSTDGVAELEFGNDKPETMETFKNILEKKNIDVKEITSDLAFFADKYDIQFLLQLCCFHFCTIPLSKENFFDMVKIASMGDHDKLFKKITNFIHKNRGTFDEIAGLKTFVLNNPQCSSKITNIIMFEQ